MADSMIDFIVIVMKNWIKTNSFPLSMALFMAIVTTIFIIFSPALWTAIAPGIFTVVIVLWAMSMKAENDPVWFWKDKFQLDLLWIGLQMAFPVILIFALLLWALYSTM